MSSKESIKSFFYYLPIQIVFVLPIILIGLLTYNLTTSWLATMLIVVIFGMPLGEFFSLLLALSYPEEYDEYL